MPKRIALPLILALAVCIHLGAGQKSLAVTPPPPGLQYHIVDIGPLPSIGDGPKGVNNAGVVVGSESVNAYYWQNGIKTFLVEPLGHHTTARAISEHGIAAGDAFYASGGGISLASLWTVSTNSIQILGNLGDANDPSFAFDVNESGFAVGYSDTTAERRGFLWNGSTLAALPLLDPSGRETRAYGINESNVIVGGSDDSSGREHPVKWVNGTPIGLNTQVDFFRGEALDINDAGVAVGYLTDSSVSNFKAAQWTGTSLTALSAPTTITGNPNIVRANAINSTGWVVGQAGFNAPNSLRAVLWTQGVGYDLNGLITDATGWSLRSADGLNDQGWIVGTGVHNGEARGFLLSLVPEPTTAMLIVMGGALALGLRFPRSRRIARI